MADKFDETVEKLSKASIKLDAAAEKMSSGGDDKSSASAEDKKEKARRESKNTEYLASIAGALSGFSADDLKAGSEEKKTGGIFTSIAKALGGVGAGVGKAVGGFMKGVSAGAASGGLFVKAMGFLGGGLAVFGAAIGAATWLVSKMMPDIAKGLKEFKDVDGSNLINVGLGMGALGTGFAAMGAGGAIQGVGNLIGGIAEGVGGLFGIEGGQEALIEKLKKFSKIKLNVANIKANSEAMVAYGVAMTAGSAGSMLNSVSTLAAGAISGLGKLLGGVPVVTQLIDFSKLDIDGAKVKKNAEAMVAYAGAMTAGAGAKAMESVGSVFNVITSFTDGISKLLGGKGTLDTQLESLQKISAAKGIDPEKVKLVAGAMVAYAGAMTVGAVGEGAKAVGSLGNLVTNIADGLGSLIGGKGKGTLDTQLESLKKISAAEGIDPAKIKLVAGAMVSYAKAMAAGAVGEGAKALGSVGNIASQAVDGITSFFGGSKKSNPLDDLKKFALVEITEKEVTQIKFNAEALKAYSGAMAAGAAGEGMKASGAIGNAASQAVAGLVSFFGGSKKSNPLDDLKKFALTKITEQEVTQIKQNASGLTTYMTAMNAMKKQQSAGEEGVISKLWKGFGNIFGKDDDPMDQLEKFTKKSIDPLEVKYNVDALKEFSKLQSLGKMPSLSSWSRFARDLVKTIPNIEAAIMGGQVIDKAGIGTGDYVTKGLASGDIKFKEASINISELRASLGMKTKMPSDFASDTGKIDKKSGDILWQEKLTKSVDGLTTALMAASGGAVNNVDASTKTQETKNYAAANVKGGPNQAVLAMADVYG